MNGYDYFKKTSYLNVHLSLESWSDFFLEIGFKSPQTVNEILWPFSNIWNNSGVSWHIIGATSQAILNWPDTHQQPPSLLNLEGMTNPFTIPTSPWDLHVNHLYYSTLNNVIGGHTWLMKRVGGTHTMNVNGTFTNFGDTQYAPLLSTLSTEHQDALGDKKYNVF